MGQHNADRHRSTPDEESGSGDDDTAATRDPASDEAGIGQPEERMRPEETLDRLEEKVLGMVTSQSRDEDEDIEVFDQDIEDEELDTGGATSEPSD